MSVNLYPKEPLQIHNKFITNSQQKKYRTKKVRVRELSWYGIKRRVGREVINEQRKRKSDKIKALIDKLTVEIDEEERKNVENFIKSLSKDQAKQHKEAIAVIQDRILRKRSTRIFFSGNGIGWGGIVTEIAALAQTLRKKEPRVPLKKLIVSLQRGHNTDLQQIRAVITAIVVNGVLELSEENEIYVPKKRQGNI